MNKQEFLARLRSQLSGLSMEDIRKSLDFYSEMIDDRMEEGISEEEAVAAAGDVEQIASQIRAEAGAPSAPSAPKKAPNLTGWGLALILLGFPLWLPLLIAAASIALALVISATAIVFSIYVSLWAVVVSLFAVVLVLALCSIALLLIPLLYIHYGNIAGALLVWGAALVLSGITILLFLSLVPITKAIAFLSKMLFRWLKGLICRKEAAK